jgi:hypothetical protein
MRLTDCVCEDCYDGVHATFSSERRTEKEKVVSSLAFPVACNACKNFGEWMENASRGLKRIKTGFEFLVGE